MTAANENTTKLGVLLRTVLLIKQRVDMIEKYAKLKIANVISNCKEC